VQALVMIALTVLDHLVWTHASVASAKADPAGLGGYAEFICVHV
jgi:hypothetical protein